MSGLGTAFQSSRWPFSREHETDAKSYCARTYYSSSGTNSWDVYFVIMRNLDLHISDIDAKFAKAGTTGGPSQNVIFEEEAITLDIPVEGIVLENGWTITPYTLPMITKDQVDHFVPGSQLPSCQLYVECHGEQEQPVQLIHRVKLLGAKQPNNFFLIRLPTPQGGMTASTPSKPQLKDLMDALYHKVADKWRMIGVNLEIPKGKLVGIAKKCRDDPHSCLVAMLETWLERVDPPATWTAIIEAVQFLGEEQLEKELREKYYEIERTPSKSHVSSGGETKRTPNKPQLKDLMNALYHKVADKWKMIGVLLEIPKGKLAGIAEKCQCDPHSCLVAMLETWLERVHPPPTWTAIIEAVEFLGEEQLGKELREKCLHVETSPVELGVAGGKRMRLEGRSYQLATSAPLDHHTYFQPPAAMSDEEAQTIVDQALASGSLRQRNTVAVVVGIVGSGKTWLIHRLFQLNPPDRYTSTGIAEKSFRGLLHRIANMDTWELLSQEDILEFLAPLLKAGLTKADIASLAKTFTEAEASQLTAAVSPAKTSIEGEAPQPTPTDVPSPSCSHATVAQPQPEKNYATQAMINLVQTVEGSEKNFIVEFLHMIDTGGQPEFIEIMPSLIHNSNFTLLVLNLAQSLDEYPPIDYHEDGTAFKRRLPSVLTNRQVIHQYARTLQAKRPPTHTGTNQPSIFTVIGTHRDRVKGKLTETLAAVNKELKSIFLPAMEDELIVYRSRDEIIFPVNLLEPDDNDKIVLEQIRQKISDAHIVEKAEIPLIPFSFFMFEQNAIKYAQKKAQDRQVMVLSFDECVQIGTELKMSSEVVRAALIYFHRHNIFLYFQNVLPNLVFLAPRVPLDFVNAIVAFSYKVKSGTFPALKAKYVRFCNEGIITEEMLHDKSLQFSDCFVPGIYEPQHAIKLFRHIYTIAELTDEEPLAKSQHLPTHSNRPGQKSTSTLRKREYLMMSLLADIPEKDIKKFLPSHRRFRFLPSPSKVTPLVIHFSNGCVPNGCFGNVISCLISKYSWKVCQTEQGKPECLAHNIVTLRDPMLPVTITIVNHTQHLEVHINMAEVKEVHFSEICSSVRTTIFATIENVFKLMRFEDIIVEPAFLCNCRPKSHSATICHLSTGSYIVCCKTKNRLGCLLKKHLYWFQDKKKVQRPTLQQLICFKTSSGSINTLEQIGTHYQELGVLLLDDCTGEVTKAIIEQYHYDATNINLEILQRWIQGKGKLPVEWSTLVVVLKDIGLVQLASEMEQTLK